MKERATGSQINLHPLSQRQANPLALETLRYDLLSLGQLSGILSVIVPSLEKIRHDHCYCGDEQQMQGCNEELSSDLPPLRPLQIA